MISANKRELDKDYVFFSMQMMAKEEIHTQLLQEEFDAIVIDEVHHAGAESYQKIMDYIKTKFWLGMTII